MTTSVSLLHPCTAWTTLNDWRYDDDHPDQVFDLLIPNNTVSGALWTKCPLVMVVHGGGWSSGNEAIGGIPFDITTWVKRGFAVASVRYRLSPANRWPAQIQDVLAAHRELQVRAALFRIWDGKMGAIGFSAGAHLVAMAAVASQDPAFRHGNWPGTPQPRFAAVVVDYGPSDFRTWRQAPGGFLIDDPNAGDLAVAYHLFGTTIAQAGPIADAASPALRVGPDAVPALIRHGTADPVVPYSQGVELKAAYDAAGREAVLTTKSGAGHGTVSAFYGSADVKAIGDMFDSRLR